MFCSALLASTAVLNPMLQLHRHSSARVVRALRDPAALGTNARLCSILRRGLASSRPHDNTPPLAPRSALSSANRHYRSVLVSGRLHTNRRRAVDAREEPGLLVRPRAAASVTQQQWRGQASSAGNGKGKGRKDKDGAGEEEGMFGRLKKTFEEEIEKVRSCEQFTVGYRVKAVLPLYSRLESILLEMRQQCTERRSLHL